MAAFDGRPPGARDGVLTAVDRVRTVLSRLASRFSRGDDASQQAADGSGTAEDALPAEAVLEAAYTDGAGRESAAVDADGGGLDESMMPNEMRVRRLLQASDGAKQQIDIVDETDWSASKVSRTLSGMEEDDLVTRIRLGQGNLVFLSGAEPDVCSDSDVGDVTIRVLEGGEEAIDTTGHTTHSE